MYFDYGLDEEEPGGSKVMLYEAYEDPEEGRDPCTGPPRSQLNLSRFVHLTLHDSSSCRTCPLSLLNLAAVVSL